MTAEDLMMGVIPDRIPLEAQEQMREAWRRADEIGFDYKGFVVKAVSLRRKLQDNDQVTIAAIDAAKHIETDARYLPEEDLRADNFDRFLYYRAMFAIKSENSICTNLWNAYVLAIDLPAGSRYDLTGITVALGDSRYIYFRNAKLTNAVFVGDCTNVDLSHAVLDGTNFRAAENVIFDSNSIAGAVFPISPNDPFTTLRAKYSGTNFAVVLALSLAALAPHILKGFVPSREKMKVWEAVLQWREGVLQISLTLGLLLYAGFRGFVTIKMGQMRDAMEWSLRTPRREDYWWLWGIHKYFLSWFLWVAFCFFCWKVSHWLVSDRPHIPEIDLPDWMKRVLSTIWKRVAH